jgi:hypothetical protein
MYNNLNNSPSHLNYKDKTNLGSFYTPAHIVKKVYELLDKYNSFADIDVLLEPSCGYGAFFNFEQPVKKVKLIGADIDKIAVSTAKKNYPSAYIIEKNALFDISREKYGISSSDKVIIVGNPPYNDKTSLVKSKTKEETIYPVDATIQTRDIGMSSLLAYNKLQPEYIAVLHPLSYLIKKTNFNILKPLMDNYKLIDSLVFSSQEFLETSKTSGFPVVIAIYKKNCYGTSYGDIENSNFKTLEGDSFCINDFDYIDNYIYKYPGKYKKQNWDGYLFYTLRDINALKRSRTFIREDIPNAIQVQNSQLKYFEYIDIFKDYSAKLPYFMGNLNIPINNNFNAYSKYFSLLSKNKHPEIFGKMQNSENELNYANKKINEYFEILFKKEKNMKYKYVAKIPIAKTNGKVRVKKRKMIYEYGYPVATRSTEFSQDMYIEWQIGYDAILNDIENGKKFTSLKNLTFVGANKKTKSLYELSEIVYHLANNEVITKDKITNLITDIEKIQNSELLDQVLEIKRSHPKEMIFNNVSFEQSTVEYPLLVHKFGEFDIIVEIVTKEKQYAVGIMPMLYLCFPVTKLNTKIPLIGRIAEMNEEADLIVDETNASVFLEMFRLFGMLSPAHKYDVLEILKLIESNV